MRDRRDEAIVRSMAETGTRAGEVAVLKISDIDPCNSLVIVCRGKGRRVPIGPRVAQAIDRYIRSRRTHRVAETDDLWLGDHGKKSPTTLYTRPSACELTAPAGDWVADRDTPSGVPGSHAPRWHSSSHHEGVGGVNSGSRSARHSHEVDRR